MDVPLAVEISPVDDGYQALLHYQDRCVSDQLAQDFACAFTDSLLACLNKPYASVRQFAGSNKEAVQGCLATKDPMITQEKPINGMIDTWSEPEKIIRTVLARFSGIDEKRIQKDTSMYQLGLDSLNTVQVAKELRSHGLNIDVADIMETLTPISIAARAQRNTKPYGSSQDFSKLYALEKQYRELLPDSLRFDHHSLEVIRPCTSIQSAMLAESFQSHGKLYVNHVAYQIPHGISKMTISSAWTLVLEKYEVLRSGFSAVEKVRNPFGMLIYNPKHTPVPYTEAENNLDLDNMQDQARTTIMDQIASIGWHVTISSHVDGNIMLLSLHHALYDGNVLRCIVADFQRALCSPTLGLPTRIDNALQSILEGESDADGGHEAFWKQTLNGVK